ncbi:MAG: hypothetical protein WAX77_13790 [Methylococcaceae bacterium]
MENKEKKPVESVKPLATASTPTTVTPISKNNPATASSKQKVPLYQADIYSTSCTQIRDLFLKEVKSMTRYSMSSGMDQLPDHIYPIIEAFSIEYEAREKEKQRLKDDYIFDETQALDLTKLVEVHDLLSKAIAPATPRAILLLDPLFSERSSLSWLSPVPLLRRLMVVAFFSLMGFIGIALSPDVSSNGGDIFHSDGMPLFVNLMFFVFSASLGACFAALFQANNYIVAGIFDPKYEPSYWIRLLVGIMAGLILASLIPLDPAALNGLGKPTLSLLGGFSASLVYRILNLLVGVVEDMVKRMSSAMLGERQEKAKD